MGDEKICLTAQTTENQDRFNKSVEILRKKSNQLVVFNTICSATRQRQESALEIAKKVDLMIVIGV